MPRTSFIQVVSVACDMWPDINSPADWLCKCWYWPAWNSWQLAAFSIHWTVVIIRVERGSGVSTRRSYWVLIAIYYYHVVFVSAKLSHRTHADTAQSMISIGKIAHSWRLSACSSCAIFMLSTDVTRRHVDAFLHDVKWLCSEPGYVWP